MTSRINIEGNAMTESEFIKLTEAAFIRIENGFDNCTTDVDYIFDGQVLELEFENGSKIIINRHTLNQEIWLAAKSGGYHYSFSNGQWLSKRDGSELFSKLQELVRLGNGDEIQFL